MSFETSPAGTVSRDFTSKTRSPELAFGRSTSMSEAQLTDLLSTRGVNHPSKGRILKSTSPVLFA